MVNKKEVWDLNIKFKLTHIKLYFDICIRQNLAKNAIGEPGAAHQMKKFCISLMKGNSLVVLISHEIVIILATVSGITVFTLGKQSTKQ